MRVKVLITVLLHCLYGVPGNQGKERQTKAKDLQALSWHGKGLWDWEVLFRLRQDPPAHTGC